MTDMWGVPEIGIPNVALATRAKKSLMLPLGRAASRPGVRS